MSQITKTGQAVLAYILAKIVEVSWKCDDGVFVTLNQAERMLLLTTLMTKKNELFTQEMEGVWYGSTKE